MLRWLIAAMVVAKIVNYLYVKIPDNAEEPWKLRIVSIQSYLVGDLAYLTEYFGYDSKKVITNFISYANIIHMWLYPPPNDVTSDIVSFEGMLLNVYRPIGVANPLPAILMFANGGWMMAPYGSGMKLQKRIASLAKVAVYGFSYERRTPDHPFPAAFEDCETVTRYLMKNAEENNIIPGQIGVIGESAGGNLAMAVALKLAKYPVEGVPPLKFQALFNPILQSIDFNLTSYHQYDIGSHSFSVGSKTTILFFLSLYGFGDFRYIHAFMDNSHTTIATKTKYRKFVNSSLLGENYKSHHKQEKENAYVDYKIKKLILNPYFSPLMASDEDLSRLPNTYITVSEYTVVRDEGMILAKRLMKLNHTVKYNYLEGMSHGIFRIVEFKRFNEEYKRLAVYINETFGRSRSYT